MKAIFELLKILVVLSLLISITAANEREERTDCVLFSQPPSEHDINIDGNPADWNDIEPIAIGKEGTEFGFDGSDIKALYLVRDLNYLYAMIELHDPPTSTAMPRDSGYGLYIYTDEKSIKEIEGYRTSTKFYEIRRWSSSEQVSNWYEHGGIMISQYIENDNRIHLEYDYPDIESAAGEVVEMKIPLKALGNPDQFIVQSLVSLDIETENSHQESTESSTLAKIIKTISEAFKKHTIASFTSLIAIIGIVVVGYGYMRKREE